MKTTTRGLLVLTAILAGAGTDVGAQQDLQRRGAPAMEGRGQGIEAVMRLRERLELTEDQVSRLDALRRSSVERRNADQAAVAELRSQLQAGQIDRDAFAEQTRARREAVRESATAMREQVDAILTQAQKDELDQMRSRARAFAAGRASAMRGGPRRGAGGPAAGSRRPGAGFGPPPAMRGGQPGMRGDQPGMRGGRPGMRPRGPAGRPGEADAGRPNDAFEGPNAPPPAPRGS